MGAKAIKEHSDFFPSMPVSLSGIIHHSQSYHNFNENGHVFFVWEKTTLHGQQFTSKRQH